MTRGALRLSPQQGDASKNKTKVWQNKSKGAKKTAKSKKKKLTKKKALPPSTSKAKQANGNVAGNVRAPIRVQLVLKLEYSHKNSDKKTRKKRRLLTYMKVLTGILHCEIIAYSLVKSAFFLRLFIFVFHILKSVAVS